MKYKLTEIKNLINNLDYSKNNSYKLGDKGFRIHTEEEITLFYDDFMSYKNFTLAGYSRNYNLNETDISKPDSLKELKEIIEEKYNVLEILPLYMYEHSGVALSTSDFNDKWDSGCIGYVFMTHEQASETGITTKEKANEDIKNGIELWNRYNSEYMYSIEFFKIKKCECCGHTEEIDRDWLNGFWIEDLETNIIEYIGQDNIEE